MVASAILDDLKTLYDGGKGRCGYYGDAGEETVSWWARQSDASPRAVLDAIARRLAKGYLGSEYDWDFGDWIANKVLFPGIVDFELGGGPVEDPEPWWAVYLAFDDSEMSDHAGERARENLADLHFEDRD